MRNIVPTSRNVIELGDAAACHSVTEYGTI